MGDVENILHDYEDFFLDCEIGRLYDPTLESCPTVDCENTPMMMEAVATLTSGACEDSCDYSCSMAFQIVLSVHDVCDEDDVPYVLETSLHGYEEICEEHLCNSVGPDFDITLVDCDDHDDHDDHDDEDDHDDHDDDHDDHEHGEPCYCLAMENAWELDCLNTTGLVLPALEYIIDPFNGCSFEDAGSDMSCLNNYHIVQAHHDHCPHDALDVVGEWMDVENILHDYEDFFLDCEIGRLYDPTLESCPTVDCENTPAMMEAVATLTSGACEDSCDYSCSMAFQIVLSVHDVCDEDDVPYVLETSLHDYEEICEEHLRNSVGPDFDITLVDCDDHDDHDDHDDEDDEDDHDDHDDDHEDDHDD